MSTTRAPIRIAAIEVSHWHSLYDASYLRHLAAMPDVELVGLSDPSRDILAHRAAALGRPPTFTDYRAMLAEVRPDFVIALGRHRGMAETAHYLLDHGLPFLRVNRPTSGRYPAWGSPWMLDPAEVGGGCLRNLGSHGLDLFLHLTGEGARVTGAQVSHTALGQRV